MPRANVLLLVTGGIAAYKASYLTRLLMQTGFSVRVAMTDSARRFVTPLTFEALSQYPVATDLWGEGGSDIMDHIEWAQWADLVVVAPATANLLAKAAHGIADDMVTTLLLAAECPLIVAPAMNDAMWRHSATQANVTILSERGVIFSGPGEGDLACGTVGEGRMAEPETILAVVQQADLTGDAVATPAAAPTSSPWSGQRVVVTAGPTWEPVDPVRYLANRSTGVFGYALDAEAVRLGADVVLISGPTSLTPPAGLAGFVDIETAAQLADAVKTALDAGADWLFMAAAVADFRAVHVEGGKAKKESLGTSRNLEMTRTVDILGDVVGSNPADDLRVVGFALETDDLLNRATDKMRAKGMDFIIANDLSAPDSAFGVGLHCIHLIGTEGTVWPDARGTKDELAAGLFEQLAPWIVDDGVDPPDQPEAAT